MGCTHMMDLQFPIRDIIKRQSLNDIGKLSQIFISSSSLDAKKTSILAIDDNKLKKTKVNFHQINSFLCHIDAL